jgi:UDP-hydrolysing UDP-N-acetyl-D-glucosamine 2-epimerase
LTNRRICIVTGTRAEYGLLYWLMKEIENDNEFDLQLIVTGMHLSPEFGLTYKVIEEDGFTINEKIEMLLSSDTPAGIAKSIGLGTIGFADAFQRLKPDLLVLLGDRYEILAAAQAALVMRIPIAHIAGGDVTVGAFDEEIRHCLTKMSHLHFATNRESARRIRQLGENPQYIYNTGSPGIDYINKIELLTRGEVEGRLNFRLRAKNILVTFHPVTLDIVPSVLQFKEVLSALDKVGSDSLGIIFTKANSDPEGRAINQLINEYVKARANAVAHANLGQVLYLSTVKQVNAVVGNSSSGIYEVPSFKIPTVNIGSRQKGRMLADSVIQCAPVEKDIAEAIKLAFSMDCSSVINPYGDGNTSQMILAKLKSIPDYKALLNKRFFDMEWQNG